MPVTKFFLCFFIALTAPFSSALAEFVEPGDSGIEGPPTILYQPDCDAAAETCYARAQEFLDRCYEDVQQTATSAMQRFYGRSACRKLNQEWLDLCEEQLEACLAASTPAAPPLPVPPPPSPIPAAAAPIPAPTNPIVVSTPAPNQTTATTYLPGSYPPHP